MGQIETYRGRAGSDDNDARSASAFSRYARFYDDDEQHNRVARWTRSQNLSCLHSTFKAGDFVLEVGCGTGAEAISLAERGMSVVATDAAPGMITRLDEKLAASSEQVRERVTSLVMPAAALGSLMQLYGSARFDGAYSSFGPLNCEADLAAVARLLGQIVRPGGKVVISLLGRFCAWETAWYLLHGQPAKALRRLGGRAQATVRGEWQEERITVWYWSSAQVAEAFGTNFNLLRREALPWLLPPQYLSGLLHRRSRLFLLLVALEARTAPVWPGNLLGDHLRYTFVRK